ncbi:MAG: hypothetical protein ACW981_12630 [Candidatus Hodarchaeales archaeon]|jgi:hypothetical protein
MTIEQEIYSELKKKLMKLVEEKNLSFSQAADISCMLSDEFCKVIGRRYP